MHDTLKKLDIPLDGWMDIAKDKERWQKEVMVERLKVKERVD